MTTITAANQSGSILDGWVAGIRAAVQRNRIYRDTLAELESLNDRELADIGLSRVQIRDIAREHAALAL
jgi:uncharacterized protein YjiS (DUF1127 family)